MVLALCGFRNCFNLITGATAKMILVENFLCRPGLM